MGNFLYNERSKLKRKADSDNDDEIIIKKKRQKLSSTRAYIHDALFCKGEGSDITLIAFKKEWKYHKVYLSQSEYFQRMFCGRWSESKLNSIELQFSDDITEEAFKQVIHSMYFDEIEINNTIAPNVLAAANYFAMDELITFCVNVMLENISCETVCNYYEYGLRYNQSILSKNCLQFLECNLFKKPSLHLYKNLSQQLVCEILNSSDLYVYQVESDVYSFLRKWLFLQLNLDWEGDLANLFKVSTDYYKDINPNSNVAFLDSPEGLRFIEPFKILRLDHVIGNSKFCLMIKEDNIIPKDWQLKAIEKQWLRMLSLHEGKNFSSKNEDEIIFLKNAVRCGRILLSNDTHYWRWAGFNLGMDLLFTWSNGILIIKRNSNLLLGLVDSIKTRDLLYRIRLFNLNKSGHKCFEKTTSFKRISMQRNSEHTIIELEPSNCKYPLYICCYLLYQHLNDSDLFNGP